MILYLPWRFRTEAPSLLFAARDGWKQKAIPNDRLLCSGRSVHIEGHSKTAQAMHDIPNVRVLNDEILAELI